MAGAGTDRDETAGRVRFRVEAWAGWFAPNDHLEHGGLLAPSRPLPGLLRRRITPVGRRALEAAWAVLPDGPMPRLVLSSRHGEYERTFGLLNELAATGTASPAEFSLSVHHALAGLLSIATGGTAGHTAVSSGAESFGFGLIEAAACAEEDCGGAILLHFDAPLPDLYRPVAEPAPPALALAVRLGPPGVGLGIDLALRPLADPAASPDGLAGSFLALLRGAAAVTADGARFNWQWSRGGGDDHA